MIFDSSCGREKEKIEEGFHVHDEEILGNYASDHSNSWADQPQFTGSCGMILFQSIK